MNFKIIIYDWIVFVSDNFRIFSDAKMILNYSKNKLEILEWR